MDEISVNMFNEFELKIGNKLDYDNVKDVETLCDAIWDKVKKIKFGFGYGRNDIVGEMINKIINDYYFKLYSTNTNIIINSISNNIPPNWKDLTIKTKMQLIETLPDFLKKIEKEANEHDIQIHNFLNKFNNLNLGDTWK
jgi:hypothetical protein